MKSAARRVRGRNDMHSKYEAAIRHATYFMSGDLQRSRQHAGTNRGQDRTCAPVKKWPLAQPFPKSSVRTLL